MRERYLASGWGRQVFTWHEAADTALFQPVEAEGGRDDLVWIGNWGDGERERELNEFLIEPARRLGLTGIVHGVRYPPTALQALRDSPLKYRGWLANADVPRAFAQARMTLHVPRRPYTEALPGIPTIRMFEALACGIPLVSAPWQDSEELFRTGEDFLMVRDGREMAAQLDRIRRDPELAASLASHGLQTIHARHTCAHRVDELLAILGHCGGERVRREVHA